MPTPDVRIRILVALLRVFGVVTTMGFLAMFLPVDWMAWTHRRLGLGEFPRTPIVDYLTRSIAGLYGFHGVLVLIAASNPVKYRVIVTYIAVLNVVFGLSLVAIDLHAGVPSYWTALEGPPIVGFGIVLLVLARALPRA